MRLTSLELVNFRGFKSLILDLHRQVTVLVGTNGSGKSTALEAIAMELEYITGVLSQTLQFTTQDHHVNTDESIVKISGIFKDRDFTWGHRYAGEKAVEKYGDLPSISRDERENGPVPMLSYYNVARHAEDETPGPSDPVSWHPTSAWHGGHKLSPNETTFNRFFKWFREREDIENEDKRENPAHADSQLDAVRKALESLLPGYENPRIHRRPKPVLFVTKDGKSFAFNQLSEGERTLAALGCDIARRMAIANPGMDPLKGEGIVLIDEIDLHLHPKWQANIVPALLRTFPGIQFIVTTHSPIVLSHIKSECVRLLENFSSIQTLPPTWGREPNSVLNDIFDMPLRPQEVSQRLKKLTDLIDDEKISDARQKLETLRRELGEHDRELVGYETMIELLDD